MKTSETVVRILGIIPFAILSLIGALYLWYKWNINFIRFGGEAIAYTDKDTRKNIKDIYNLLEKDLCNK